MVGVPEGSAQVSQARLWVLTVADQKLAEEAPSNQVVVLTSRVVAQTCEAAVPWEWLVMAVDCSAHLPLKEEVQSQAYQVLVSNHHLPCFVEACVFGRGQ